jgi:hypothetical protein
MAAKCCHMEDCSKEIPISSSVFGDATVRPALTQLRPVIRPIELLQAEGAEAQRGVLWKRRCALDPFANGGGYTDAIAKSIAV